MQWLKVRIVWNNYKELSHLQGIWQVAEVSDLSTKEQITELGKCKEDDEEHDKETNDIFLSFAEGARQLGHCLVETHILEYLWQTLAGAFRGRELIEDFHIKLRSFISIKMQNWPETCTHCISKLKD